MSLQVPLPGTLVASETDEAEDLCSQVFLRALRGLHTYRGGLEIPADDQTTERIEQADDNTAARSYAGCN